MNCSLRLGSSLARQYMHCPSAFVTSSPNAGSPKLKPRRYFGPSDIMKPELDSASRTVPAHIPVPSLPLQTAGIKVQTVPESQREEMSWSHVHYHSDCLSILHPCWCPYYLCCNKCSYSHPPHKCPTLGQQCYACGGPNHFTVLCRQKNWRQWQPCNTPRQGNQNPQRSSSRQRDTHSSQYLSRHSYCHGSSSCSTSSHWSHHSHHWQTPTGTPGIVINVILTGRVATMAQPKGSCSLRKHPIAK